MSGNRWEFKEAMIRVAFLFFSIFCGFDLTVSYASEAEGAALPAQQSVCVGTVCFPKSVEIGSQQLPLLGAALFKFWMFEVYTAALYLASESPVESPLAGGRAGLTTVREHPVHNKSMQHGNGPIELTIEYHREIAAKDIAKSAEKQLRLQNSFIPEAQWQEITRLHAAYRDVGPGDRYRLRFQPGVGSTLFLNDQEMITIPGDAFANYYFRIWLDAAQPLDKELRDALLGKAPQRKN